MIAIRIGVIIPLILLAGLTAGAALAETAPICDFKQRIKDGNGARYGIPALFVGKSGTGKTMAAKILAAELGMDLYRVDLAAVINKYIGETEKNLAQLFDKAESENLVLYFDEADSLFGKRGEVKDAHDRYGNLETEYLLAQIESHDAPVILATNRPPAVKPRTRRPPIVVRFVPGQPHPRDQLKKCR
jgi:SpoVK/Ycf46/Vps4 family AAA+-type ATPase